MSKMAHTQTVLNAIAKDSESVIVSYSGGKDSLVLLDIASKKFKNIYCFFMYVVKDISFQKVMLQYAKEKYNVEIKQYPHFQLSKFLKSNTYKMPNRKNYTLTNFRVTDIEDAARNYFNCDWVLTGLKQADSVDRRIMLRTWENEAISKTSKRAAPLSKWTDKEIKAYMKYYKMPTPENFGCSTFDIELSEKALSPIKENYPNDYNKIIEQFPFAEAIIQRKKFYGY